MSIPFTQYLRPNGKRCDITVDRPPEVEEVARVLLKAGIVFEAEVLTTGHVSLTAETRDEDDPDEDEVLAHEIVPNGPEVLDAVDRLVAAAAESQGLS